MRIPNSILNKYAERRGISFDEASEIAAMVSGENADDGMGGIRDFLGNFADLAELTQGLPEQAQTALAPHLPVLAMGAAGGGQKSSSNDMQDFFKQIVMFKEGIRVLDDTPKNGANDQMAEYIGTLTERLTEIEERMFDKQEDERMKELKTFVETLTAKVDEVKEAASSGKNDGTSGKKSAIEELVETATSIETAKKKLREVGLLSDEKPSTPSLEDAEKQLVERGYEVKKPQSYADIQQLLADHDKKMEEEWAAREDQIRQETLDTEERRERNMRLMMDLGSGLLDTIVSAMTAQDQTGVTGLMKLKNLIGKTYGAAQAVEAGTGIAEAAGVVDL